MITKQFLETYPLLRKYPITFDKLSHSQWGTKGAICNLPKPALNLFCKKCQSMQTFNMENDFEHFAVDSPVRHSPVGKIFEVRYLCAGCGQYRHTFYIEFGVDRAPKGDARTFSGWIRKIGQLPPWEIDIDKNIEKALGDDSVLYKKGLICESQSYGIGSYAYFRRITENIIDELLNSISDLIDEGDKEKYEQALEKVKKTRVTEEKIELVQDLLPLSLQPNGLNPLKSLHSALSAGIHNKTDEECLELAETIKEVLIYLLEEIKNRKNRAKEFTERMKRLLKQK
ncbi:MAG: hypothetical protein UV74_C0001G0057 [Candidatus Woesebacteria bacterium GW2011_GWB1_43_14]|uniref:DUF4145 domain-containing protein n=1 Tax=Candidatus Woesebacteria bacterium GW2011_GWB1_43_14 TaxID=1618578 RepID=A0A0G1DMZ6_9BACT|nr:MAG: hypothetical protein UT21_C0003G0029 [Candidatus Woesebacteria bacterium GW2011_GWA1_39_11b]KKS78210.1 MAG: hypothetical protein UV51_C0002G0046 [Candidatus Woesebacteria bacterium GW2011_GWC1_42_9]KKS98947.1 MAG: hypothetical protein UV74_C0001G0057 [Candidatus Woesebacteria bacterium GW2011_GWB1_43_14]